MIHDEIERALRRDETIEPSLGFSRRVMRGVHHEVERREELRFPWLRLLPGLFLCLGLISASAVAVMSGYAPPAAMWTLPRIDTQQPMTLAILALLATLAGSYVMTAGALRVAGYRR